jgi:hypothetical protein
VVTIVIIALVAFVTVIVVAVVIIVLVAFVTVIVVAAVDIGTDIDVVVVSVFDAFKLYTSGTTTAIANNPQRTIPLTIVAAIYLFFDDVFFSALYHQK